MRVLIVEDERRLAENIAQSLVEQAGYAVDRAEDGLTGLHLALGNEYDGIVLDLMLPALDGRRMLERYRGRGGRSPVLVLTARDEKEHVVSLLNAGADDYVSKPFDLGELLARLNALIRRSAGHASPRLELDDLTVDTAARTVSRGGRPVELTPMEYRVLEYLLHRRGVVVPKAVLLEHLYDGSWDGFGNVIEVYVAGLRRKLDDGAPRKLIHTVRGHGYVLRAEP